MPSEQHKIETVEKTTFFGVAVAVRSDSHFLFPYTTLGIQTFGAWQIKRAINRVANLVFFTNISKIETNRSPTTWTSISTLNLFALTKLDPIARVSIIS